MTAQAEDSGGVDALVAGLRAYGRDVLPAGFEDSLPSFSDMMAAISAMPQQTKDDLADEVEKGALRMGVKPLGLACPACGAAPRFLLGDNDQAFCGDPDCAVMAWNPRDSAEQFWANAKPIMLTNTGNAEADIEADAERLRTAAVATLIYVHLRNTPGAQDAYRDSAEYHATVERARAMINTVMDAMTEVGVDPILSITVVKQLIARHINAAALAASTRPGRGA